MAAAARLVAFSARRVWPIGHLDLGSTFNTPSRPIDRFGTQKASRVAEETMKKVRDAVKLT